jgi:hypothetical protein
VRIVFPIARQNYYRLLAPVIDEALGRGLAVECWHDYGAPRASHKGYLFPDLEETPKFVNGTPVFRTYAGPDGLAALLATEGADAVVAFHPPRRLLGSGCRPPVTWFLLQDSASFFVHLTPEDLLGVRGVGVYSAPWLDWGLGLMQTKGLLGEGDPRGDRIRARCRVVGFPELDACGALDRVAIRARLGLPPDRPVVTFMPYPYRSNPQTFWLRWIYANPRRALQAAAILASGRHAYWPHLRGGWHDRNLVRAVRAFCDANGAALIVKYREKDPLPSYLRQLADVTLAEPVAWPPPILETLAVADLAISFYSATVLEAAYLGVPYLCIAVDGADWLGSMDPVWWEARETLREGGQFNFSGVTRLMTIPSIIEELPRRPLAEFRVDPARRQAYVARFIGPDDGRSAARMIDLVTGQG